MDEKKLFNFFPIVNSVFAKCVLFTFALWIIGHAISYFVYGEVARTDLLGSTFAGFLFAYFLHLIIIFKSPEEDQE